MVGAGKNVWPNVDIEEGNFKKNHDYYSGVVNNIFIKWPIYILCFTTRSSPILLLAMVVRAFILPKMENIIFTTLARPLGRLLLQLGKQIIPNQLHLPKKKLISISKLVLLVIITRAKSDYDAQGSYLMGSNCRAVANRSRSIGWKPVKTTKDLFASIKPEVVALIQRSEKAQKA